MVREVSLGIGIGIGIGIGMALALALALASLALALALALAFTFALAMDWGSKLVPFVTNQFRQGKAYATACLHRDPGRSRAWNANGRGFPGEACFPPNGQLHASTPIEGAEHKQTCKCTQKQTSQANVNSQTEVCGGEVSFQFQSQGQSQR